MWETVTAWVQTTLAQNQFLSAGALLGSAGFLLHWCRQLPRTLYTYARAFYTVTVEIRPGDEFDDILLWLANQPRIRNSRRLSIMSDFDRDPGTLAATPGEPRSYNEDAPPYEVPLTIAPGRHWLIYRNRLLLVYYDNPREIPSNGAIKLPSIELQYISRNRENMRSLFKEAHAMANPPQEKQLRVYIPAYGSGWNRRATKSPRPWESLVLQQTIAEDLMADAKEFLARRKWYTTLGIPYRRGYLFTGPPGNGKSSVAAALAGELELDLYTLILSKDTGDSSLLNLLTDVRSKSVLLIEDIDRMAFHNGDKTEHRAPSMSTLLNSLDGVCGGEERILIMTTNHPEKLNPALTRDGRIDRLFEFKNANKQQAKRLFEQVYAPLAPKNLAQLATEFAAQIPDDYYSMAALQGWLIRHRDDPLAGVNFDPTQVRTSVAEDAAEELEYAA